MFDKDGNLKNWWDQTSMAEFLNRERCLVNQYQQYTVQGHHVSHVMRIAVLRQCGKKPRSTIMTSILYILEVRVLTLKNTLKFFLTLTLIRQ